ncbi:MAG: hypothetical protein MR266_05265 [Erysipelotrichaceae bacterium]|nr:hypothetical protein [Erysipelotrichaceae bacterium]
MIMKSYIYDNYTSKELEQILSFTKHANSGYPTSNCIVKGKFNNIFFKKLNLTKICELYNDDYLLLFNEYYTILNKIIRINKIFGIIQNEQGIFEFSELLDETKLLDDGNSFEWGEILNLFDKILIDINACGKYNDISEEKIGFETAIWNFTIDGILFDLDPPKILKTDIDSSFTRKDDIDHKKRTLYRSFDEIGMKFNLLVTLILGEKHNSFIVKKQPSNYIEILIERIIKSSTNNLIKKQIIDNLVNGVSEKENFIGHPIEIVRREIMMIKKGNNKIFIFVAGTSESGKSGGINYLKDNYSEIQHIKIRDVFPKVYEDTFSKLSFEEWQNFEENRDLNNFWKLFVNKVYEMVDDNKSIIILDTMYGVEGMIELYNILGDKVNLLYIDAPFNDRVMREYNRLRSDSIKSTRKADLTITIDDIIERTIKKDRKKNKRGADKLPLLTYSVDNSSIEIGGTGEQFTTIINNDGTIDDFYIMLDNYINSKLKKSNEYVKELKK